MRSFHRTFLLLPVLALLLAGCSSAPTISFFPGVHRINILQGNIIVQDKVDQLRLGMTKNQVRFVMGTPLVSDPFHLDQWEYIYNLRTASGAEVRRQLQLLFENGELVSIQGDFTPASMAESPASDDLS